MKLKVNYSVAVYRQEDLTVDHQPSEKELRLLMQDRARREIDPHAVVVVTCVQEVKETEEGEA